MTQTDIPHDTHEEARDIALLFLTLQRRKDDEHRQHGEQLALAAGYFVRIARERGVPWTDVAHALGVSVWAARRVGRRRLR